MMMRTSKMAGIVAVLVATSVTLFGQAATEGALAHALSSAVGSTAGRAMGGAANQPTGRVGQRVASAVSTHPVSARKATPAQAAPTATPLGGSLIASIQGGAATDTICPSTTQTAAEVQKGCSVTTSKGTDDHPSVINLPALK
jgi:hypothetical protein